MKIGIIGAMEIEVAEIKESMENIIETQISNTTYYEGTIHGKNVVVAKSGVADLVISDFVVEHDMDTSALGDPVGFISGLDIIKIPCAAHVVEKIKTAAESLENTNVFVGTIASGDQFICSENQKNHIVNNFDALCAEMEGAAIGHVCYLNSVDFCIVRAMSDKADGSAHMDFPSFVKIAAKKSTQLINNYLKSI
ncbi:MAG: nucleosidase [Bacillota bacterium]|nr:nucleosidase [Bacillota bacterium]